MDEPIDETNVDIAVRFLNNSNVKDTEREKQEEFLKSKGLSCAEIDAAYRHLHELELVERDDDSWSLFDYLKGIVLGAGILSAANFAYKAYILPYATRELKDDQRIEGLIESFQVIKDDIKQHTYELTGTLKQIQALMEENQKSLSNINSELKKDTTDATSVDELKTEISMLKSMMLSKDQFPAAPFNSTKPKVNEIPAWQRIADEFNSENLSDEKFGLDVAETELRNDVQPLEKIPEEVIAIIHEESEVEQTAGSTQAVSKEQALQELPCSDDVRAETPSCKVVESDENGNNVDERENCSEVNEIGDKVDNKNGDISDNPVTTELNGILYEVVPSVEKLLPVESNPEMFTSELSKEIFIEGTDVLRSEYDLTISSTDKERGNDDDVNEETKICLELDPETIEKVDMSLEKENKNASLVLHNDADVEDTPYNEVD